MTKGGRIAGAILAMVGGGFFLVFVAMGIFAYLMVPMMGLFMLGITILFIAWMIFGLVGGILLLKDKWLGGFFPILGGTTLLLFFFLEFQLPGGGAMTMMYSTADPMVLVGLLMCLVLILGGIFGLVFKAEES